MRGDPLATDQSQPTSHFTTSQTRTSHFTPAPDPQPKSAVERHGTM